MPAMRPNTARAYCGYTECPLICHKTPRTIANVSRFAQSSSQIETNARITNQQSKVLTAATFIFVATISTDECGRTAMNGGSDRSPDQKSGLENALPSANARIIGIAIVATRT